MWCYCNIISYPLHSARWTHITKHLPQHHIKIKNTIENLTFALKMKSDSSSQLTEWKTISQTIYSKSHARGSWLMSYILLSKHTYTHTYSWSSKKRIWNGWNQHSFMQETVLPYHSPSSASCSQQLKLQVHKEISISHDYATSPYFIRPLSFSLCHDLGTQ